MEPEQLTPWTPKVKISALARQYSSEDLRSRTPEKPGPPEEWIDLIKRIDVEVTALLRHRETWQAFRDVAARSQVHQNQPYFSSWVGELYAPAQALGVRKMVDQDTRSGSFTQLLTSLANQPDAITREWFVGGTEVAMALHLDQTFTRIADPGYTGHLDGSIPRRDLAGLQEASRKVGKYVSQHVAHAQLRPNVEIPTYEELDAAVNLNFGLLRKYLLLLTGGDRIEGPPVFQMPWQRVFTESWLPAEADDSQRSP